MNVGEVVSWLCEIELGHLAPRFRENGVDGACLADLTRQELVSELGLTQLQARRLIAKQQP
jgi:hypothetical protein